MQRRVFAAVALGVVVAGGALAKGAFAKNKNEKVLPAYILNAHTVSVMIDPQAGMSADDPRANEVARKDVETALLNWGRYMPVINSQGADLIIVVRKGHERVVNETISPSPQQNNRPGVINPMDNGVSVGAQHGAQQQGGMGGTQGSSSGLPDASSAHPQMEIGTTEDSFEVLNGDGKDPLNGPVGWRYLAKDGLRSHTVPAVDEFRKAVAASDKAMAAKNP